MMVFGMLKSIISYVEYGYENVQNPTLAPFLNGLYLSSLFKSIVIIEPAASAIVSFVPILVNGDVQAEIILSSRLILINVPAEHVRHVQVFHVDVADSWSSVIVDPS